MASGKGILTATLCWTDPRGTPGAQVINNSSIKLINDLDIRITRGALLICPGYWTRYTFRGSYHRRDNIRDNVEKIEVSDVERVRRYKITVIA